MGACSELVFAPIDEMFPDDAPLLPSGFRIIPLDSKSVEFICSSLNNLILIHTFNGLSISDNCVRVKCLTVDENALSISLTQ